MSDVSRHYLRVLLVWAATLAATPIHERAPSVLLHSDVHIGNWYQTDAGRMGLCGSATCRST